MTSKNNNSDGEICNVFDNLMKLALLNLGDKHKSIIAHLVNNSCKSSVTKCVDEISLELTCAKSTVWNVMRELREFEIVSFPSVDGKENFGLTTFGFFIATGVKNEKK